MNNKIDEYRKFMKEKEVKSKDLLDKLKEEHNITPITVNDNIKNTNVCFVFSCPGQEEMLEDKVCAGQTGINLDNLLIKLKELNSQLFNETDRYKYDIINASNIVHFIALDNKTEASLDEINANKNRIVRYIELNNNLEYVIFFGYKSQKVKDLFKDIKIKMIDSIHLSFRSLNQIEVNEVNFPESNDRTEERLRIVANNINDDIVKK